VATLQEPVLESCEREIVPENLRAKTPVPGRNKYEETFRRLVIWIAIYLIPGVLMLHPITDPDVWWHLRTGQWIVEQGNVTATDPFSSYGQDKPWVAYSWLFEVGLYGLFQAFGLTGILLFRVLMSFVVLVVIHAMVVRHEPRFARATVITGIAFLALAPILNERPWLFSILFCALTLEAIRSLRDGPGSKAVWLLPLGYALWANLHIQFVYGLFLLGLACAAPLLDRLVFGREVDPSAKAAGSPGWWKLVALTGACVAATLINPYHVGLYGVALEYAGQSVPYEIIQEFQALAFRGPSSWAVLALAGAAAFALGRRARLSTFDVLLLAATAYFAFHSRRDVWFVVLAAVAILGTGGQPSAQNARGWAPRPLGMLVAGAGVALLLVFIGGQRNLGEDGLEARVADKFPTQAAAVVEDRGYAGPLFNDINWGGYLIWRLPQRLVCLDCRTNLHGDERMLRHVETMQGLPGWDADPDLVRAGVVIIPVRQPLASLLRFHPRFQLVYEDPVAAVFVPRPNHSKK
jgi:hypothetical protein